MLHAIADGHRMMGVSLNMVRRIVKYPLAIISPSRDTYSPVATLMLNPEWQNVLRALGSARDVAEGDQCEASDDPRSPFPRGADWATMNGIKFSSWDP